MISKSTITYNRPTMSCKIDFYNLLVAYFKMTEKFGRPNENQRTIAEKINTFGNDNTQNHTFHGFKIFSEGTINRLRPMHKRKARLYNLLVAYADFGRFDIFENLVRAIYNTLVTEDVPNSSAMISLLGFGDFENTIEDYLLNEFIDELTGNDLVLGNDFVCSLGICEIQEIDEREKEIEREKKEQEEREIKERYENEKHNFRIEIDLNCTRKEIDEFVSYLESANKDMQHINYTAID